jgi:nitrous oxidase accessory protein NosD
MVMAIFSFIALIPISAQAPASTNKATTVLFVPRDFPTIASAIKAAHAGDTIQIAEGRYSEQLVIRKDLTLRGEGVDDTVIAAPATLVKGSASASGRASIVEISGGATVRISRLTVSGPGAGTCAVGRLDRGITVVEAATLHISDAAVTHIRNTPLARCVRSGTGIALGDNLTGSTGHATITRVAISDYLSVGILLFNAGTTGTISHNVITGRGRTTTQAQTGIELLDGPVATITDNVVSGNLCDALDLDCGPDPITQLQGAAFALVFPGPGTVISHNTVSSSDIGLYLFGLPPGVTSSHNTVVNNRYFGVAIQDGDATISDDRIVGGQIGVGIIADFVDTVGTLRNERIRDTSLAPIKELSCCGFTAKAAIVGGPPDD